MSKESERKGHRGWIAVRNCQLTCPPGRCNVLPNNSAVARKGRRREGMRRKRKKERNIGGECTITAAMYCQTATLLGKKKQGGG